MPDRYFVLNCAKKRTQKGNPTMTNTTKHNDEERRQWIMNDEGLYNLQRSSRLTLREFIRQNRAEIDAVIDNVLSGNKPAHYLAYGPERRYF